MRRVIRFALFALTITLAMSAARTSLAGFSAELLNIVQVGPNYQYNYELVFNTLAGRERVEAGSGALAPGVIGSQDFVTLYDVGLPAEIQSVTPGAGFTHQTQLVGVDAAQTLPLDGAVGLNVTFRYAGPPAAVTNGTVFTGFQIVSSVAPSLATPVRVGQYSSQHTDNLGNDANLKISELGPTEVPASLIPEPGTWALLVLGFIGAVAMKRRTSR
jgi:hypothetical protein